MFKWLFANRRKNTSVVPDVAMRANIADKLKNYNADDDKTISEFSLAEERKEKKAARKMAPVRNIDAWGHANPGETGKWNRENRRKCGY